MMQRIWAATMTLLLVTGGCVKPPAYDPFRISRSEFHAKMKTVAMSPLLVPKWAGSSQAVKSKMEGQINEELQKAGFKVIPPEEFGKVWDRLLDQMGGYYDPITGKMDKAKLDTIRDYARREVGSRLKVDAFCHASIALVGARMKGSKASWDGTSESTMMGEWYEYYEGGTIQALSLVIVIEDKNGVDMYVNRGGIQLSSKIDKGRFVPVPMSELLANEARNIEAVKNALKPLIDQFASK